VEKRRRKIAEIENGKVGQELPSPEQVLRLWQKYLHVFLPHDAVSICERNREKSHSLENPKPPLTFRMFSFFPFNKLVNQFKSKKRFLLWLSIFTLFVFRGYVGVHVKNIYVRATDCVKLSLKSSALRLMSETSRKCGNDIFASETLHLFLFSWNFHV
jgi:hypothetical protein